MTFAGEDLYPDVGEQGGGADALAGDEPSVRGRQQAAGAAVAELFLNLNGVELEAADDDLVAITLSVARGEVNAEALAIWLRQRSRHRER